MFSLIVFGMTELLNTNSSEFLFFWAAICFVVTLGRGFVYRVALPFDSKITFWVGV